MVLLILCCSFYVVIICLYLTNMFCRCVFVTRSCCHCCVNTVSEGNEKNWREETVQWNNNRSSSSISCASPKSVYSSRWTLTTQQEAAAVHCVFQLPLCYCRTAISKQLQLAKFNPAAGIHALWTLHVCGGTLPDVRQFQMSEYKNSHLVLSHGFTSKWDIHQKMWHQQKQTENPHIKVTLTINIKSRLSSSTSRTVTF